MNQVCEPSKGMCEVARDAGQVKDLFLAELKVAQTRSRRTSASGSGPPTTSASATRT